MPRRKRTTEPEHVEFTAGEEILPEDLEREDGEEEEVSAQRVSLAEEPLFAALLRQTVTKLWPADAVMTDFVSHIAGPLSEQLGTRGAKGGDFAAERAEAGESTESYKLDQS